MEKPVDKHSEDFINQIDYLLINKIYHNSMKISAKRYPVADTTDDKINDDEDDRRF